MNNRYEQAKAGFIGLGQMGQGMAANLLQKHGQLFICDTDPARTQPLVSNGAVTIATPAELAGLCDVVFLCLPDSAVVDRVLFGDNGLLATTPSPGTERELVIVDTTTLSTEAAIGFEGKAKQAGASYSDCPVTGLPKRAEDGTLTLLFGGHEQSYTDLKPLLSTMGSQVLYCGNHGSGQMMKSVNNIIYNINITALCEVIPLALAAGLDEEAVVEVVHSGSSNSFAAGHFVPKMLRDDFSGDFPMQSAYKDIENFRAITGQGAASQSNTTNGDAPLQGQMPLAAAMMGIYEQALENGFGELPKSSMIKLYRNSAKKG